MNDASYDARIVHTVRKLKSNASRQNETDVNYDNDNKLTFSTESSKEERLLIIKLEN